MDVELLSRILRELITAHDEVGLPSLGVFVAEMVPASFSDRGYTINPPYRRLSFIQGECNDTLLVDFYAKSNRMEPHAAETYITDFLQEMRKVLEERKTITLPGLGRLRATKENALFFVQEEGLDIFPDGFGLRSVSLKHIPAETDTVEIPLPFVNPDARIQSADDVPVPESSSASETVPVPETVPASEPAPGQEPVPVAEPAPDSGQAVRRRSRLSIVLTVSGVLLAVACVLLAVFVILAHAAPDFIDSILYTPEELRIINY